MASESNGVAVVGVGAIGTVAAGSLMERGLRPLLCVRRDFEAVVVDGPKAIVRHTNFETALQPTSVPSPQRLVVVATKAHQTSSAAEWLSATTGPTSVVLVLQNGVEQVERVRPFVHPDATILPGVVDIPAQRTAPGTVLVGRSGSILLPEVAAARDVAGMFAPTDAVARVETTPKFEEVRWRKLAVNVISGAIPAITDRPAGVFREPEIQRLARALVEECLAVARAKGLEFPADTTEEIIRGFLNAKADAINSMLRDRREGRPLEADARNGAVARFGAELGIPTPYNDMAATVLGAVNQARPDERNDVSR